MKNIFVLFRVLVYIVLVMFPKLINLRNLGYDLVKYFLKNFSFHYINHIQVSSGNVLSIMHYMTFESNPQDYGSWVSNQLISQTGEA